jgi:hypothetical protein
MRLQDRGIPFPKLAEKAGAPLDVAEQESHGPGGKIRRHGSLSKSKRVQPQLVRAIMR